MSSSNTQARKYLLGLVEEHTTTLIRDAVHIARQAKRARTTTATTPPNNSSSNSRVVLHASDINLALQLSGSEKLYATGVVGQRIPHQKVLLEDVLKQESIPPVPAEVALFQKWLAVDGEPTQDATTTLQSSDNDDDTEKETPAGASSSSLLRVHQLQAGLLSEELKLYFQRVTAATEKGASTAAHRQQQDAVIASLATYYPGLQELVPFLIRYCQQQLYTYSTNTEHCRTIVRLAMALLRNPQLHLELHIHELLPALMTCVVAKKLLATNSSNNMLNSNSAYELRREAGYALAVCCAIFTEYTTLKSRVLKSLCTTLLLPPDDAGADNAGAGADGDSTTTTKSSNLPSMYGGIAAITNFGPRAIEAFLLPVVLKHWEAWEQELSKTTITNSSGNTTHRSWIMGRTTEIHMCQQAMLTAVGVWMRSLTYTNNAVVVLPDDDAEEIYTQLQDVLGDRLVVLTGQPTEYNLCFV